MWSAGVDISPMKDLLCRCAQHFHAPRTRHRRCQKSAAGPMHAGIAGGSSSLKTSRLSPLILFSIRKRRCIPIPSDDSGCCQLCKDQSIPCSLTVSSSRNRRIVPASSHSPPVVSENTTLSSLHTSGHSSDQRLLPPKPVIAELVDLYFRLIHDGPHTLFHEPTFISKLASNLIPEGLLFAVISLSTR